METNLKKLVPISSGAFCDDAPQIPERLSSLSGVLGEQLIGLLKNKNGFYAFESALHVLPAGCKGSCMNIEEWNDDSWRKEYGDLVQGYLFFAEDVFGVQFALCNLGVRKFDPEIGEFEDFAPDLEKWVAKILEDYNYETGYQFSHDWQLQNGPLPPGKRLLVRVHNIVNTQGSQHREQLSWAKAHNIVNNLSMLPEGEALWTRKKNAFFVAKRSVGCWMV